MIGHDIHQLGHALDDLHGRPKLMHQRLEEESMGCDGLLYRIRLLNTPPLAAGTKAGKFPLSEEGNLRKGWGAAGSEGW
jgi:hypothetical protein